MLKSAGSSWLLHEMSWKREIILRASSANFEAFLHILADFWFILPNADFQDSESSSGTAYHHIASYADILRPATLQCERIRPFLLLNVLWKIRGQLPPIVMNMLMI